MAAALPMAKLAALMIKTLSKPVSKALKNRAVKHKNFSKGLVLVGQGLHQASSRMTVYSAGYHVNRILPLAPEKALDKGADFFSEFVVLAIASSALVWEYNDSAKKTKKKEQAKMLEMEQVDEDLQLRLELLEERCEHMERVIKGNDDSIFKGGFGNKYEDVDIEKVKSKVKEKREKGDKVMMKSAPKDKDESSGAVATATSTPTSILKDSILTAKAAIVTPLMRATTNNRKSSETPDEDCLKTINKKLETTTVERHRIVQNSSVSVEQKDRESETETETEIGWVDWLTFGAFK